MLSPYQLRRISPLYSKPRVTEIPGCSSSSRPGSILRPRVVQARMTFTEPKEQGKSRLPRPTLSARTHRSCFRETFQVKNFLKKKQFRRMQCSHGLKDARTQRQRLRPALHGVDTVYLRSTAGNWWRECDRKQHKARSLNHPKSPPALTGQRDRI